MQERFLDRFRNDYNFYAVAGFFFSLIYLAAIAVTIFVEPPDISVRGQDLFSGVLLALATYGTVVMLAFGIFGLIYTSALSKKGRTLALITLIMPFSLLLSIYYFWPNVFL